MATKELPEPERTPPDAPDDLNVEEGAPPYALRNGPPYPPCPPPYIPPYPPPYCYVRGEWSLSFATIYWELIDPTAIRVFLRINCVDVDMAVLGSYQPGWTPPPLTIGGTTVTLSLQSVVPTGLQLGMLRVVSMTVTNTATDGTASVQGVILQMWTPQGIPYPYPNRWPPPGRPDGFALAE